MVARGLKVQDPSTQVSFSQYLYSMGADDAPDIPEPFQLSFARLVLRAMVASVDNSVTKTQYCKCFNESIY